MWLFCYHTDTVPCHVSMLHSIDRLIEWHWMIDIDHIDACSSGVWPMPLIMLIKQGEPEAIERVSNYFFIFDRMALIALCCPWCHHNFVKIAFSVMPGIGTSYSILVQITCLARRSCCQSCLNFQCYCQSSNVDEASYNMSPQKLCPSMVCLTPRLLWKTCLWLPTQDNEKQERKDSSKW